MQQRRVFLINVFGHTNLGDGALVESCLSICANSGVQVTDGVALFPEIESQYSPIRWHKRLLSKPPGRPAGGFLHAFRIGIILVLVLLGFPVACLLPLLSARERKALLSAKGSIVISAPGGYLEDSNPSYLVNLLNIFLFSRVSCLAILAPMSIGPIRSRVGQLLIKRTLPQVDKVFCRESFSLDFVRRLMPRFAASKVEYSGDVAFLYQPSSPEVLLSTPDVCTSRESGRSQIGITIVDWGFHGHPHPSQARQLYVDNLRFLLDNLLSKLDATVCILTQVASDDAFAKHVCSGFDRVVFLPRQTSVDSQLAIINKFDFFIGSRFHSCIFSMLASTPFVCLSYLPKCSLMMSDLGLSSLVLDLYRLTSPSNLFDHFLRYYHNKRDYPDVSSALASYQLSCRRFASFLSDSDALL